MGGFFRRGANKQQDEPSEAKTLTLAAGAKIVEDTLINLKVDLTNARLNIPPEQGYGWHFMRGSATIQVFVDETDGRGYFRILSPIIHLPHSNILALYRRLLEMNLQLTSASLGVHRDIVYVFNERFIEGLDPVEAQNIIMLVAGYADDLDNQLVREFGGRLYDSV